MASNFDLIGARVAAQDDLERIANGADPAPEIASLGASQYLVARDGNGAEIWFGLEEDGLIGVNPFFAVGRPVLVRLDAVAEPNPDAARHEALLDVTLLEGEEEATRLTLLGINIPEAAAGSPATGALDICVFSHKTVLFDDDDAFNAVEREIDLAPQSFLPSGMFTDPGQPHRPLGFGAGRVTRAGEAPGRFGGGPWYWAEVATLGGHFGVVWAPTDCPPAREGQILSFDGVIEGKAFSPFWQAN